MKGRRRALPAGLAAWLAGPFAGAARVLRGLSGFVVRIDADLSGHLARSRPIRATSGGQPGLLKPDARHAVLLDQQACDATT